MKLKISKPYVYSSYAITDIEGEPDETSVTFEMSNGMAQINTVSLRDVKKQFPNVDTIIIGKNISRIDISNFMFPNVKRVISHSKFFVSDSACLMAIGYRGEKTLYNTFCKGKNEVIDMDGISSIESYAFEGCMSTNLINMQKNVSLSNVYMQNMLHGSMFLLKESK